MLSLPLSPPVAAKLLVRALIGRPDLKRRLWLHVFGGPGSGNFGHAGRPGEVGGSAPSEATRAALERAIGTEAVIAAGIDKSGKTWKHPTDFSPDERGAVKEHISKTLAPDMLAAGGVRREAVDDPFYARLTSEEREKKLLAEAEAEVQLRLDLWATTSGDSNRVAVEMQQAIKKEFALSDAVTEHMRVIASDLDAPESEYDRLSRIYSRVEYEHTQAWFKEKGITEVTIYRGQKSQTSMEVGSFQDVVMQPASSWTTSLDVASQFASAYSPHIFSTKVPVSRILSTCVTGRGCLKEAEVILLGGKIRVKVGG